MGKIRVKNFGPIKEGLVDNDGFVDIKKVTVFIGNQGSGKSTIAKLISTCTWIEKALVRGDLTEKYITKYNRFVKTYCAYQNIQNYFREDTEIRYQGEEFSLIYLNSKLLVSQMIDFSKKNNIIKKNGVNQFQNYLLPKIMYVPSERNLASTLKNANSIKGLPQTLYTFIDEYENALNNLKGLIILPIGDVSFEYQKLNNSSFIIGEDYKINISEASSGFQSYVPLHLVSQYLSFGIGIEGDKSIQALSVSDIKKIRKEMEMIMANEDISNVVKNFVLERLTSKFKNSWFFNIVEEPEQNLFPSSQRSILNSLLEFNNLNEGNKLIMTTHSPYLINYLTLAIKAESLQKKYSNSLESISKVVPANSFVKSEDVAIYELDEKDGTIKELETYSGLPSDENELNEQLDETNELFSQLLEIQQQNGN